MFDLVIDILKRIFLSPERYARSIGVKVGKNCLIMRTTNFSTEPYLIELGDHVMLSVGVLFVTHDGGIGVFRGEHPEIDVFGKIKIGPNTFIGANSILLPGIVIGSNCIIGAGSVVSRDVPDNVVFAGTPAKYVCSTEDYKKRIMIYNAGTGRMNYKRKKQVVLSLRDDQLIRRGMKNT